MKKILFTLLALLMAWGASAQTSHYTVSGTAEGTVDGDTVYLATMQGFFQIVPLDTTVVRQGRFAFTGHIDGADDRIVVACHGGKTVGMTDFILEDAPIHIQLFTDESKKKPIINGGPSQALYDESQTDDNRFAELYDEPYRTANDTTLDASVRQAAQHKLDSLNRVTTQRHVDFIIAHIPSPISDMFLGWYQQEMSPEQLTAVLDKMKASPVQYGNYKRIVAERKIEQATAVGQVYTDMALKGTDGKTVVRLSDYVKKNRYTLLDFWASWCGPCRAEMPNVVKAYQLYHAKGFEVVGVSLDNNRAAWLKAIAQLKMPWPQMSDLKGWDSKGAAAYHVRAIPANVLIDQKGMIVAKDLRGEDLLTRLAALLK